MKWSPAAKVIAVIAGAAGAGLLMAWLLYPSPIVTRQVEVPQLRGQATSQAIASLAAAGLRGRLASELEDPLTPAGTISWQSPAAGTALPESSVVRLGVSSGTPRVLVPDLVDLDIVTASEVLSAAGLTVGNLDSAFATASPGTVLRSRPEPRAPARAGSRVDLTVSKGPRSRP